MAKFLNTSATNYMLEELIKSTRERLVLISPYLKLSDKIKELLEDGNRLKIDIRVVYGKKELQPAEINWLKGLQFVRTFYCDNLHAKCYMNEDACIITSMNLYEFSQVNNNEMGILIQRAEDAKLYKDAHDEVQRIIRISGDGDIPQKATAVEEPPATYNEEKSGKLSTAQLAQKLNMNTKDLEKKLTAKGYLELRGDKLYLTDQGKAAGGEFRKGKFGYFFLWPDMDT